jgi:hypothetical protein
MICFFKGDMMAHYYYIDHAKQQSSAQSDGSDRGNNQQLPFICSGEILHGKFFLFGQSVWIVCQLLGRICFLIKSFYLVFS